MALNLNKELKLYYSIGEVSAMFGVAESLLRFWEKEFPEMITPRKAGRNVRQYTKEDIEKIRLIYHLVKEKGMKLAAARASLQKNKSGEQQTMEVLERLQNIKQELQSIRKELSEFV